MGFAVVIGSVESPLSLLPRKPLIPLRMMALGEAGVAVGNVDWVGEMTAEPLRVGAIASPGDRGKPARSDGGATASGKKWNKRGWDAKK